MKASIVSRICVAVCLLFIVSSTAFAQGLSLSVHSEVFDDGWQKYTGLDVTSSTGHGGVTGYTLDNIQIGTQISLTVQQDITIGDTPFRFVAWKIYNMQDQRLHDSDLPTITFEISENVSALVEYSRYQETVTLSITSQPAGAYIDLSPLDNNGAGSDEAPFTRTYDWGTAAMVEAAPHIVHENELYIFSGWEINDAQGTEFMAENPIGGNIHHDMSLTAIYVIEGVEQVALTVEAFCYTDGDPINVGMTVTSPTGHGGSTPYGPLDIPSGTGVTLTAENEIVIDETTYRFIGWKIDDANQNEIHEQSLTITWTIHADSWATARYLEYTGDVTVSVASEPHSVFADISPLDIHGNGGGETPFTRTYEWNTFATIEAPPSYDHGEETYNFAGWSIRQDGVEDDFITMNPLSGPMFFDVELVAVYELDTTVPEEYSLYVYAEAFNLDLDDWIDIDDLAVTSSTGHGNVTPYALNIEDGTAVSLTAPAQIEINEVIYGFVQWKLYNDEDVRVHESYEPTIAWDMVENVRALAEYLVYQETVTFTFLSEPAGANIHVSPMDNSNQSDGTAPFNRSYSWATIITVQAEDNLVYDGNMWVFDHWRVERDGNAMDIVAQNPVEGMVQFDIELVAVYQLDTFAVHDIFIRWGSTESQGVTRYEFGIDLEAEGVEAWRFKSPEGTWYYTYWNQEGGYGHFDEEASTMAEIEAAFPPGDYEFEFTLRSGAGPVYTIITTGTSPQMPSTVPAIISPSYGRSNVPTPQTTIEWQSVPDPDFDVIVVIVDDPITNHEFSESFMGNDQTSAMIDNLVANKLYSADVIFGNLVEGENAGGVPYSIARYTQSRTIFGTNTVANRFEFIDEFEIFRGFFGETEQFELAIELTQNVWEGVGEPLFYEVFFAPPGDEWFPLYSWDGHSFKGDYLDFRVVGDTPEKQDLLATLRDGWHALVFNFGNDEYAVTSFWYGEPGTSNPLAAPTQHPTLISPAPGSTVVNPVVFEWNEVDDPNVTHLFIGALINDDYEPVEEFFSLAEAPESFGPVNIKPGEYEAVIGFLNMRSGANADGIAYLISKYTIDFSTFNVFVLPGDANLDCVVNILDLIYVRNRIGQVADDTNWQADVNGDGQIDMMDLLHVRHHYNTSCEPIANQPE